jgi:hypothetical protein
VQKTQDRPTRQNAKLSSSEGEVLKRITDRHGNIRYDIADKQSKRGRNVGKQSNTIVMFAGSILVKRAQHNTIKQHSAVSLAKCHYVKRTGVVMRLAAIYHVWMSTLKRIVKQLDALELMEILTCSQKKYKLTFIGRVGDLTEHLFKCEPNILVA